MSEQATLATEAGESQHRVAKLLGGVAAWAVAGASVASIALSNESRETNIASHDAVVSVTHDGFATFDGGAAFPTLRYPLKSPASIGVHVDLGRTDANNGQELIARYAAIATQPSGEVDKVKRLAEDMFIEAGLIGGVGGLAVPVAWALVGARRRRELLENLQLLGHGRAAQGGILALTAGIIVSSPHITAANASARISKIPEWQPVSAILPDIEIPPAAKKVEVQSNFLTDEGADLLRGGILAYRKAQPFYAGLTEKAKLLAPLLRQPKPGEVVMLLVADRHDNLDVDPVDRAIGEAGGSTIIADAGDDTSDGSSWESFSLNSLISQSKGFKYRLAVSGNHDHGTFVSSYLSKHGFRVMDGKIVSYEGISFLGLPDPKSSGFVNSASFANTSLNDQARTLADIACAADKAGNRISAFLLHEAAAGKLALARGCVDLVLGGHLHRYVGPDKVIGENGKVGYAYTTTTAGGAAFAISLGPLRRDAGVTLVTFRGGMPIGLQKVTVTAAGELVPSPFIELAGLESNRYVPTARQQRAPRIRAETQSRTLTDRTLRARPHPLSKNQQSRRPLGPQTVRSYRN